jgi:hypothetical protein
MKTVVRDIFVNLFYVMDHKFKFQGMFDVIHINGIFITYGKDNIVKRNMAVCIGYL